MSSTTRIRLFQRAVYAWLAIYLLAILCTGEAVWANAPVQLFRPDHGVWRFTTRWEVNRFSPFVMHSLATITMLGAALLFHRHRWWLGLLVWLLFRIITHRTWLASNGGVQLMENMLLWSALMGNGVSPVIATIAFWIGRLQLLVAYAAAAAHKYTGTAWLDGSAVLRVANDPGFPRRWLADHTALCTGLTYAALAFMSLFPFAIWWRPSRRVLLIVGTLFHLSTAVFMGIPQMGLAFIACYALWLDAAEVERLNAWWARLRPWRSRAVT